MCFIGVGLGRGEDPRGAFDLPRFVGEISVY